MQELAIDSTSDGSTPFPLITDMCSKVGGSLESGTIYGYLQGENCKYYMSTTPSSTDQLFSQQKSLEDMLLAAKDKPTRRQRYAVSLILASSFIQLQNTPWITSLWEKSSIVFPEQSNHMNGTRLDAPFVSHNLVEGDTTNDGSKLIALGLRSLGVTLLELCFGDVIENHPERPKLPLGVESADIKTALDAQTATVWLGDVTEEAGPDFMNAIRWCLSKHLTLHDESDWRQEMLEQVVWPLCKTTSIFS